MVFKVMDLCEITYRGMKTQGRSPGTFFWKADIWSVSLAALEVMRTVLKQLLHTLPKGY